MECLALLRLLVLTIDRLNTVTERSLLHHPCDQGGIMSRFLGLRGLMWSRKGSQAIFSLPISPFFLPYEASATITSTK